MYSQFILRALNIFKKFISKINFQETYYVLRLTLSIYIYSTDPASFILVSV